MKQLNTGFSADLHPSHLRIELRNGVEQRRSHEGGGYFPGSIEIGQLCRIFHCICIDYNKSGSGCQNIDKTVHDGHKVQRCVHCKNIGLPAQRLPVILFVYQ